jgi:hypothetical protein
MLETQRPSAMYRPPRTITVHKPAEMRGMRGLLAICMVGGLVGVSMLPNMAGTHTGRFAALGAPPACTRQALRAGLTRGSNRVRGSLSRPYRVNGAIFRPWGCAGRFAWAGVDVSFQGNVNTVTVLFIARNGRWQTASRPKYCLSHAVPQKIYAPACESN